MLLSVLTLGCQQYWTLNPLDNETNDISVGTQDPTSSSAHGEGSRK